MQCYDAGAKRMASEIISPSSRARKAQLVAGSRKVRTPKATARTTPSATSIISSDTMTSSQRVLEQSKQRAEWERQNAEDVQKAKAEAEHMAKIFGRPPANPTTAPDAAPMVMRPSKYKPATVESCPEDNSARSNATPTFSRGVIGLEADSDSLSPKLMASAGASSLGLSSAQPDANSTTFHDTNEPDMSSAQPHPGPIASHHASELDVSDTQPRADSGLDFGPTAAYNAGPSGPNITETQEQGDEAVGVACGGGCVNALSVLRMVKANVEYQTEVTRKQVKVWEQTNIMLGELEVEFARLQAPLERQGSMGE